MFETIQETIENLALPKRVLVACSGGLDSTVLVDALCRYRSDVSVSVVHVDYCLREESRGDADFVQDFAEERGLPFYKKVADLSQEKQGVEEKARLIRFDFFEGLLKELGAGVVILAQHQDDQAETILMQIVRGGVFQRKFGMNQQSGHYLRPFLNFKKADLAEYAREHQLTWREDVTNQDPDYTKRNQIRNIVLPALNEVNGRAQEHIIQLAEQLSREELLIEGQAKRYLEPFYKNYNDVPRLWWFPCLKLIATRAGLYNLKESQIQDVVDLMRQTSKPNGRITLSDGYYFEKSYQTVDIFRENPNDVKSSKKLLKDGQKSDILVLELDQWYFLTDLRVRVQSNRPSEPDTGCLPLPDNLDGRLELVLAKSRDRIPLSSGHKTVRRLLIDEKIPAEERAKTYLLLDQEKNVLAVFLGQKQWYFTRNWPKDRPSGKQCLVWRIEEN
ncbi:tRNA lysidine(34) synthetase TilS [Fructobacillus durionis]|uniref:tRNA(Ile)-lysidine synthase n=1 Tax=Fructobacillus durionis TaxID=283737 RepID=A0A1I1G5Q3_9LACO|nr:tRNA lysidine(34) synthetase TilS [Fructobacillus durionis]SFC06662.1 tRNA(Ile)-lysidine synthase [Fructobacillus durionis]